METTRTLSAAQVLNRTQPTGEPSRRTVDATREQDAVSAFRLLALLNSGLPCRNPYGSWFELRPEAPRLGLEKNLTVRESQRGSRAFGTNGTKKQVVGRLGLAAFDAEGRKAQ